MFDLFAGLSKRNKFRVGRGVAGSGKTCGRGVKGQKSRSGVSGMNIFVGGQNKLYTSLPRRGFRNYVSDKRNVLFSIPIKRIENCINSYLDDKIVIIDRNFLVKNCFINKFFRGKIKFIGNANFNKKCHFNIDFLSKSCALNLKNYGHTIIE